MRTIAKLIIILIAVGAVAFVVLEITAGNINYEWTLSTKYNSSNHEDWQQVETAWGIIKTPKGWIHFSNYNTDAGYVGSFLTIRGLIHYEYGMFAPTFEGNYPHEYTVVKDTLRDFEINMIKSDSEVGMYIPQQGNMKWGLTIYPSKQIAGNIDSFKEIATGIRFKK